MKARFSRIIFPALFLSFLIPVSGASQIHSKVLANGLEVIVIENHIVPLVTIEIAVKNGSFVETPEYDGLAHLYEHMFFKANEKIPSQETYLERTRELGMSWNGTTQEERVNYFFTLPVDSIEAGMEFMKNAIRFPLFLQDELERERPVVIGEYDRNESNPYFYLFKEVGQKLWYKYWSRKNVIGNREIILTATREKMQTLKDRYYIPNNSALLIAGDVTPEQGFELAERYLGDWPRGIDPQDEYPIPEQPPLKESSVVVVKKPVNVAIVQLAWHGPKAGEDVESTFAADVLSYILAQKNSQFQKNLVDSGIALSASLSYYTLNHTGPITAAVVTTPDKVLQAREALWTELKKLTDPEYYSDEQLETSKTKLEVQEIYGREKPSSYVHTVSFWWAVTGLDYYQQYIPNLRKITREDINQYVNRYLLDKPFVMGVILSEKDFDALNIKEKELLP
ncbi:MAG: M16 family metallopeptidase [Fidelibacterota bacterium]